MSVLGYNNSRSIQGLFKSPRSFQSRLRLGDHYIIFIEHKHTVYCIIYAEKMGGVLSEGGGGVLLFKGGCLFDIFSLKGVLIQGGTLI